MEDSNFDELDFKQAFRRLHEILVTVKDSDVDLEESIHLLEEGIGLASLCTQKIDQISVENNVDAKEIYGSG